MKQADRIKGGEEVERAEENENPGDKIPNQIKDKQAAKAKGDAVERGEMNKKPGDKIPTQIRKNLTAKSNNVKGEVKWGEKKKKTGDEIPNQSREKQEPTIQDGDEKSRNKKCDSVLNGEKAFLFEDETKMYRFVQTTTGYICPICKMEFVRIGQHISTKQCGYGINIEKFKEALKRYQKKMREAKHKEKDPTAYAKKNMKRVAKSENKRKVEDLDLFFNKNRKKETRSKIKRKLEDPGTFAKKIE